MFRLLRIGALGAIFLAVSCGKSSSSNPPPASVARLALTPASVSLTVGADQTVQASAFDASGGPVASFPVVWTLSDPSVASLTISRLSVDLHGVRAGSATLTAASGSIAANAPVTVTAAAPQVELDVSLGGTGSGLVTSNPAGIACGTTCSARFSAGAPVTLSASAAGGSSFAGWSGACSGTGSCTVTLTSNTTVGAVFNSLASTAFGVSVMITGGGQGTITSTPAGLDCANTNPGSSQCSATFPAGTAITLGESPAGGSSFAGWSGACSGSGACSFTLNANSNVTASFTALNQLTITLEGDGSGTVTSAPTGIDCATGSTAGCTYAFPAATSSVTLTITPSANSSFLGINGCAWSDGPTSCAITLEAGGGNQQFIPFSSWRLEQPLCSGLSGLVLAGSTYVAVGADGGTATSSDGISWTPGALPTALTMNSIATNGSGGAVAVGDQGAVLTRSAAGVWSTADAGVTAPLQSITYYNHQFVAAGSSGTLITSPDGSAWTAANSGSTLDLLGAAAGGGLYVVVGYDGTILTSPDARTWTSRGQASLTTQHLNAVAYNGARFVVVGSAGAVVTSPDGLIWTAQTAPTTSDFSAIAASGSLFAATGGGAYNRYDLDVFTSPDGVSWTQRDGYFYEQGQGMAWQGGSFFAMGNAGALVRSTDGINWTPVLAPGGSIPGGDNTIFNAIAYDGSKLLIVGGNGGVFSAALTSSDGVTWTSQPGNLPLGEINSVARGANLYVASQYDSNAYHLISSPDAVTWTSRFSTTGFINQIAWGGTGVGFVAAGSTGSSGGLVLTSPDGISWTDRSGTASITAPLQEVIYGGGLFVATSTDLYTSPDGITWTPQSTGVTGGVGSVTYGNGTFVGVVSGSPDTITSTDGVHWTVHAQSALYQSYAPLLFFGDNEFLAIGAGTYPAGGSFATSADGVTWTLAQVPGDAPAFSDAIWVSGLGWIVVGQDGSIMTQRP